MEAVLQAASYKLPTCQGLRLRIVSLESLGSGRDSSHMGHVLEASYTVEPRVGDPAPHLQSASFPSPTDSCHYAWGPAAWLQHRGWPIPAQGFWGRRRGLGSGSVSSLKPQSCGLASSSTDPRIGVTGKLCVGCENLALQQDTLDLEESPATKRI